MGKYPKLLLIYAVFTHVVDVVHILEAIRHRIFRSQAGFVAGIYRQPRPNDSCAVPCSASQFLSRPRRTALTITTTALINTLLNLQSQQLPTSSSSSGGGDKAG